jgi:Peptidase family M1 domain/Peptidase M1 N-terminal domain/ERAP1-like C-terminal domain
MKSWLAAVALTAAIPTAPADEIPVGRLPQTVTPTHYRLRLDIDPRASSFTGQVDIEVAVHAAVQTIWLHGLGLRVSVATATAGGRTLAAHYEEVEHESGVARVTTDAPLTAGTAVLHFRYEAPFQSTIQGLYRTQARGEWYAFSQMEPIDARRVFPGFDEPGFKTPFDISVATRGGDRAVSNTPELSATTAPDNWTVRTYQTTSPLPTYLVAFAVGPLQIVAAPPLPPSSVRQRPLPLRVIGTQGEAARFKFALEQTPELIRRLEAYFGSAFPYPKIDLIASPIHQGAMENAGAIIFTERALAFLQPPTARQQANFGVITAHELAHQWFGDLVTPAWWDDIWLNESFAEWMGSKIANHWRPDLGIAQEQLQGTLAAMDTDALSAGRPVHQAVTRNSQIASTFDDITYQKGAGVIAMVESYVGEERFQRGVRLHLSRHAHGTATAAQFFAAMAEASGERAVIDAFVSFVDQPGVPLVTLAASADGSVQLTQSRYRRLGRTSTGPDVLWKIPFCANVYQQGQPLKRCTLLGERSGTLALRAAGAGATVYPNASGAGYYRFAVDPALWHALMSLAPRLPPPESLTLADSAGAAFDAGRIDFGGLFEAAQVLAGHPDRTTALSLGDRLATLHDRLASPAERALLERALVGLYGERLRRLGYDATPGRYAAEPAEQQLLRRSLLELVGLSGRDTAVRTAVTPLAEHSVADPAAIDPSLRWRIWAIGLRERGAPVFVRLKPLATEGVDVQIRQDAAFALGYPEAPAVASDALDLTLNPAFDAFAAFQVVHQQLVDPVTRAGAWQWLGDHLEAALTRLPAIFSSRLYASTGDAFCSASDRQSFENVLGKRLRLADGGELAVERALEGIEDCAALRAATGDSIRSTLQRTLH